MKLLQPKQTLPTLKINGMTVDFCRTAWFSLSDSESQHENNLFKVSTLVAPAHICDQTVAGLKKKGKLDFSI